MFLSIGQLSEVNVQNAWKSVFRLQLSKSVQVLNQKKVAPQSSARWNKMKQSVDDVYPIWSLYWKYIVER